MFISITVYVFFDDGTQGVGFRRRNPGMTVMHKTITCYSLFKMVIFRVSRRLVELMLGHNDRDNIGSVDAFCQKRSDRFVDRSDAVNSRWAK